MVSDLSKKLNNGYLLFYGYSYKNIPDQVKNNYTSRMNFYYKASGQVNQLIDDVQIYQYNGYKDTGWETCDVVLFDQNSVKSLLIGFPSNAKYVLINCANFKYFHWVVLGLLRRLLIRQVRFLGFKKLTQNGHSSFWIILRRDQLINNNNFYLSRKIGIEGFLNHLRKAKTEYVVPRFFESLPALHREGGDLDLIVSDQDEKSVKQFLLENEGDIRVDIWTVGRPNYHGINYMPSYLSQDVIDKAIDGKASAKIPNKWHALYCMIYHSLYHKGFKAGVPSRYSQFNVNQAKNDYLGCLKGLAKQVDLKIEFTMEDLDEYMFKIGWRPALDTLAKIAQWNEWVNIHHFQHQPKADSGLFAIIIKSAAVELGLSANVITECRDAGYEVISNCLIEGKVKETAIKKIRGGVWNDGVTDDENVAKYHPAQILILVDKSSRGEPGMKQLKNSLRKKFDDTKTSYFHSTDNDSETWDYIKICIPDQETILVSTIKTLRNNQQKTNLIYSIRSLQLIYSNFKTNIKSILIRMLSH